MLFKKKKKRDQPVQCPVCRWEPDGGKHWKCTCGHRWNTFDTKAKCPNCKTQWEDTWCPNCGNSTPHDDWYQTQKDSSAIELSGDPELLAKKAKLEARLTDYKIYMPMITHLPYLDHSRETFKSPFEAACRMIILYTISYSVHFLDERLDLIAWLKHEGLWEKVSPDEKNYLTDPSPDQQVLINLSWRIEGAMTLAWCLNKVDTLPRIDQQDNEAELEAFQEIMPGFGESLQPFLSNLQYRSLDEIYEENLLNELATAYFRDLLFSGNKDTTSINRSMSFERHRTLNWLRSFMQITGWDETDTST